MQEDYNTEDRTRLEELILACQPWVEKLARKYARDWYRVSFEDFVQIGMMEVCKAAPHAVTLDNPMAYLCKSAQHEMINELNRMRRLDTTSLDAPLSPNSSFSLANLLPDNALVSAPASSSKRVRALNGAIRRLPKRQRAAIRRRHALPGYGPHSVEETARFLKSSYEAARRVDYRGRHNLRSDARLCAAVGVGVAQ